MIRTGDWRRAMADPCVCPPSHGDDECPRVEECFAAWSAFHDARFDLTSPGDAGGRGDG